MKKILPLIIVIIISFSFLVITTQSVLAVAGVWTCMCNSGFSTTFNGDSGDASIRNVKCNNFCVANNNGGIKTCTFKETTPANTNNPPQNNLNNPPQADKNNPPDNSNTQKAKLDNPAGGLGSTIPQIVGKIIQIFLGIIGSISLAMFVYGGFLIFTAMGSSSQIKTGQNTLVYATLGIIIVFTSYTILKFVLKVFNLS